MLQIGQAAGALASLALADGKEVRDVPVRDVQRVILDANGYILPYLDVEVGTPMFKPLQRIGATGILHGTGFNVDWTNQTWLYIEKPLVVQDLNRLYEFYSMDSPYEGTDLNREVAVGEAMDVIKSIAETQNKDVKGFNKTVDSVWKKYALGKLNRKHNMNRGQFAVLVDEVLNPFDAREVSITGEFIN